jgi:hypothetical protein
MEMKKILLVFSLSLVACEPQKTIIDFYADFESSCKDEYFIRELSEANARNVCTCMIKEVKNRWKSLDELVDALGKEDRIPRGYADYLRGSARITYNACKKDDQKQVPKLLE